MEELTVKQIFKKIIDKYISYNEKNDNEYNNIFKYICVLISYYIIMYLPNLSIINYPEWFKTLYNDPIFFNSLMIVSYLFIYHKEIKQDIRKFYKNKKNIIFIIIASCFISIFGHLLIGMIILPIESSNPNSVIEVLTLNDKIIETFLLIIYAPIVEELIFRETIRQIIKNDKLFIFTSAVLFGLLHVLFNGYHGLEYLWFIDYAFSGFILALTYKKTNSILPTMIMHFLNNMLIVIQLFI